MRVSVFRKAHFNAAHRLHNPSWTDTKNAEVFGKCNNQYFHGHNYDLIVKITGEIDPETGYVIDMKVLNDLIEKYVTSKFDHKNLNIEVEEFENINPSAEYIAVVIFNLLRPHLNNNLDIAIRLYETERNFVEYPGS